MNYNNRYYFPCILIVYIILLTLNKAEIKDHIDLYENITEKLLYILGKISSACFSAVVRYRVSLKCIEMTIKCLKSVNTISARFHWTTLNRIKS